MFVSVRSRMHFLSPLLFLNGKKGRFTVSHVEKDVD
jgi:hypothetical protein